MESTSRKIRRTGRAVLFVNNYTTSYRGKLIHLTHRGKLV